MKNHIKNKIKFYALTHVFLLAALICGVSNAQSSKFESAARAVDAVTLIAGQTQINLWAVRAIEGMGPAFDLRARTALDNAIGSNKVVCETRQQIERKIFGQCMNGNDVDLGLFMVQQGLATVDRAMITGTVFEATYIQAETQSQERKLGVWAESAAQTQNSNSNSGGFFSGLGLVLLVLMLGVFAGLAIVIMRGFQKVIEAQDRSMDMMTKERNLREKERRVVASMLDSELKANKAKIEAYRAVYEEMLRELKDTDRPPRYKKAGDVIQKQPALARSVFDRNTDKIDTFGDRLSSQLIHFYARIKSAPEYITIEPSADIGHVIGTLEKCLDNSGRLLNLADKLLAAFTSSGISSDNHDYSE
jgi:hypothetical protein